jgi:hypothetical protein
MCSTRIPVCNNGYSRYLITHHHTCNGDCVYFCYVWNRTVLLHSIALYDMAHMVVSAYTFCCVSRGIRLKQ